MNHGRENRRLRHINSIDMAAEDTVHGYKCWYAVSFTGNGLSPCPPTPITKLGSQRGGTKRHIQI